MCVREYGIGAGSFVQIRNRALLVMCPAPSPNHFMRLFFSQASVCETRSGVAALIGVSTARSVAYSYTYARVPQWRKIHGRKFNSEPPTRGYRVGGGGNNVVCAALPVILIDAKCGSALDEKRDL